MEKLRQPKGWGDDKITKFIDMARGNCFATFEHLADEFNRLIKINDLFFEVLDSLQHSKRPFEVLFFQKAYSSFMGAIQLAATSQVPEAMAILRVALESSLYGLFIYKDPNYPELVHIWLNRHNSPEDMQAVKNRFQIGNMWPVLESLDSQLQSVVKKLYERTIDYGGHPNERSLVSTLREESDPEKIVIYFRFLTDDTTFIGLGLKSSAQVGVLCLRMLELIFADRFKIAEWSEKLTKIENIMTASGAL